MSTPTQYPYAAQSAYSSLKRARLLFDRADDPSSAFIPSDPLAEDEIHRASLQRRKRLLLGDAAGKGGEGRTAARNKQNKKRDQGALVISTVGEDEENEDQIASGTGGYDQKGMALTHYNDPDAQQQQEDDSSSRILVKRDDKSAISVPRPKWHAPVSSTPNQIKISSFHF